MYSPEEIFANDVQNLGEILRNATEANLLAASAYVRRLILDNGGLAHRANRNFRMKLRFPASKVDALDFHNQSAVRGAVFGYLSPDPSFRATDPEMLSIDEYLALKISVLNGKPLTVRHIIKYVANHGGGVHHSEPTDEILIDLDRFAKTMPLIYPLTSIPMPLTMMKSIVQTVYDGLYPLYLRLRA